MRLLLDESLPRQLARHLEGHETQTVQRQGWAGLKNGVLLRAAAAEFDVFLTGDQNLQFQQNFAGLSLAVIVLVAFNNRSPHCCRWCRKSCRPSKSFSLVRF